MFEAVSDQLDVGAAPGDDALDAGVVPAKPGIGGEFAQSERSAPCSDTALSPPRL